MGTNTHSLLMVVDDETSTLSALERVFKKDFRLVTFKESESALTYFQSSSQDHDFPAIVLVDYGLPRLNGIDFLKEVRILSPLTIRCLFSGQMSVANLESALNEGLIHRFFQKPWDNENLRLHMLECLKTHELLKQATTDSLTGLLNQKGLKEQLKIEVERARRHLRPLSLLMIDVDHFKKINDLGGHLMGDAFAIQVGEKLRLAVRNIDMVSRYGGDEFAIVLPDTELKAAIVIADRVRAHISEIQLPGLKSSPTVSIGASEFKLEINSMEEFLARADKALYMAKNRGRDRVEVF